MRLPSLAAPSAAGCRSAAGTTRPLNNGLPSLRERGWGAGNSRAECDVRLDDVHDQLPEGHLRRRRVIAVLIGRQQLGRGDEVLRITRDELTHRVAHRI